MGRLLALLFCLTGISTLPAAPVPAHLMPGEVRLSFPTRVGTTWVYDGLYGKRTIVSSAVKEVDGAKLVTTELVGDDGKRTPQAVTRVSAEGVFLAEEGGWKFGESWCLYKQLHRPGRTWKVEFATRRAQRVWVVTAGPVEKVRVPAGEYTAARVEWELSEDDGPRQKQTYWYADNVGMVQMDDSMKLKSFTPGTE
jgi:hypothetical protein